MYIFHCELAERTSIREARELLFNVWGLEQGVSRKLSIFDIWCIEQKCLFSPEYQRSHNTLEILSNVSLGLLLPALESLHSWTDSVNRKGTGELPK